MTGISRRRLALSAAALPVFAIGTPRAQAAQFHYKYASNLPAAHPLNIRMTEAAGRIKAATKGALVISVFPNNTLGSDTDMLSQLRSGALEFFTLSGLILATLVPAASISGLGFLFKDYPQVWHAMDGATGRYIRQQIEAHGLIVFEDIWDNGFREITTSTRPIVSPADLKGFKIRVPISPLWTSLFKDLGAAPTGVNFSEVYAALQTHVVDGQENPLAIIETAKLYEVQKYCSLTNHMWDGFWFLCNPAAFNRLPKDFQAIMRREVNRSALQERADVAKLNSDLQGKLTGQGMVFNPVDTAPFRETLVKAGFYKTWRERYGEAAWKILEGDVGSLA